MKPNCQAVTISFIEKLPISYVVKMLATKMLTVKILRILTSKKDRDSMSIWVCVP